MPILPFLRKAAGLPAPPTTTYYLASPPSPAASSAPAPLLQPLATAPRQLPASALILAITHPDLAAQTPAAAAARFFLRALPDPVGYAYHAAVFAAAHLALADVVPPGPGAQAPVSAPAPPAPPAPPARWRNQMVEIELENKPGLAATSGGHIAVSLHWVGDIMRQVDGGERDLASATHEFKGVVLHELVHTIQHDGAGSAPGWLIESIADHARLAAGLAPPHWRAPGQGRRERGWEDAYDAGARFLEWLTGVGAPPSPSGAGGSAHAAPTPTPAHGAQPTQSAYPAAPPGPAPPAPAPPGRPRRGPYPALVAALDTRLRDERWDDAWWAEMTGAGLAQLWQEYLDYYA